MTVRRAASCLLFALAAQGVQPALAAEFRAATEDAVVLFDAPSAQSHKLFTFSTAYTKFVNWPSVIHPSLKLGVLESLPLELNTFSFIFIFSTTKK